MKHYTYMFNCQMKILCVKKNQDENFWKPKNIVQNYGKFTQINQNHKKNIFNKQITLLLSAPKK